MLTTGDGEAGASAFAGPQFECTDHPPTDALAPNALFRNERDYIGSRRIRVNCGEGNRAPEADYLVNDADPLKIHSDLSHSARSRVTSAP